MARRTRTKCKYGHNLTKSENKYVRKSGKVDCLACNRKKCKEYRLERLKGDPSWERKRSQGKSVRRKENLVDETGNRYGDWTVIGRAKNDKLGNAVWVCKCECGAKNKVRGVTLRAGESHSCKGCRRERGKKIRHHPLYHTWGNMRCKCRNPKNKNYRFYGAVGISISPLWEEPLPFLEWMDANLGPRPEGKTLDRIDVYGNYEPGNLRWATPKEQAANRRMKTLTQEESEILELFREQSHLFEVPLKVLGRG